MQYETGTVTGRRALYPCAGSLDTEISDIIYDSRKAAPGLLFVCIVGTQRDSHEFAADCAAKGVSALVIQHDIDLSAMPGVTVVKVESSRYAMALMSANLFGNPSRKMTMIGVTGTKGKTTTTHMIKSVLEAAGRKVGMIGTNGIYYMGRHKETANTTPESYELQKTFREFLDAGCDTALMEVSSQGLMMDRVAGVHYNVGVFTNLSPDHIGPGEHKTFEEYRSWKGQLFKRCDVGVVNIDDENTEALLEGHTCRLVTYGRAEQADYRETGFELLRTHDFLGVKFHVTGKDEMDVKVNMPGEFSVYNALAALAVGKVLGLPDQAIHDGLASAWSRAAWSWCPSARSSPSCWTTPQRGVHRKPAHHSAGLQAPPSGGGVRLRRQPLQAAPLRHGRDLRQNGRFLHPYRGQQPL